jgi:HlyD family secretion protein
VLAVALLSPARRPAELPPAFGIATAAVADHVVAAAGLVEPVSHARELSASVVGRIVKMNVEEGDHVAQGDIIAEIENDDLKAQQAQAEATAMARERELARLKTGARPQEISAAKAELREAEATASVARSNFERRNALGMKQIASQEQVDQARADRDTAEAHRDFLAQKLSLLAAPPRVEDVAIAEANVNGANARLNEIKAQIEKTIVRAPIDSSVLKLYRRIGETVSNLPPTAIAIIGDTSQLRVRADIDQADVANIGLHQNVWVTADAFRGKRFRGTVSHIGAQLGRKNFRNETPEERVDTKILEVLIDLEPDAGLPIGLPVDITLDGLPNTRLTAAEPPATIRGSTAFKHSINR